QESTMAGPRLLLACSSPPMHSLTKPELLLYACPHTCKLWSSTCSSTAIPESRRCHVLCSPNGKRKVIKGEGSMYAPPFHFSEASALLPTLPPLLVPDAA
uniref:Uncharacterized protein n=1 Tax=Aegilops tauschii subsp. strangulata TaxID=200361 RepID=A0A453RG07_AEGTS